MAEPTLAIRFNGFLEEVGEYLGWGRGVAAGGPPWTRERANRIRSCVASGLRRFYYPPVVPPARTSYSWWFLKPVAQIFVPDNSQWVYLPEDFNSPEGQLTVSSSVTQTVWPVDLTSIGRIDHYYQITPTTVGRPLLAAVTPTRGTQPTGGQQKQLWIYPITDQAYTFNLQYTINPDYLTGDKPYAYGGPEHGETILEACLSVAEERLDDMPAGTGPHYMAFIERLKASIAMDTRLKPQLLGQNADRSDDEGQWNRQYLHWLNTVTYNGNPL